MAAKIGKFKQIKFPYREGLGVCKTGMYVKLKV